MTDGFKTIASRRAPGRNSWRCPHCSKKEPFKSEPWGSYFNGAEAVQCKICGHDANNNCTRYGTNGEVSGHPGTQTPLLPTASLPPPPAGSLELPPTALGKGGS